MKTLLLLFVFPETAVEGGFWSRLEIHVVAVIFATLLIEFLGWSIFKLVRKVSNFLKTAKRYRVTGVWIGACKLPRHAPNTQAVEIYRLITSKEHVSFTFFHYLPDTNNEVRKYEGAGIYRGIVLSAFYYIPEAQCAESGVIVLRNAGETFKGVYAQYDLVADMQLYRSNEDFVLRRVQIPHMAQLKMMFGKPPFPTYTEARQLYDETFPKQTKPQLIPGLWGC